MARGRWGLNFARGQKTSLLVVGILFHVGEKRSPARRDKLTRRVRLKVVPPGRVSHN